MLNKKNTYTFLNSLDKVTEFFFHTKFTVEHIQQLNKKVNGNIVVICNHPKIVDFIQISKICSYYPNHIPHCFVKASIGRIFGIGSFIQKNAIPLEKNIEKDKPTILQRIEVLNQTKQPILLFLFPEGTTRNKETIEKYGMKYKHVLRPRLGGFQLIQTHFQYDTLVDMTLLYEDDPYDTYLYVDDKDIFSMQPIRKVRIRLEELNTKDIDLNALWDEKEIRLDQWKQEL
jgi:1-acyl-sn-glycerol-3-phosphate acyltransferase